MVLVFEVSSNITMKYPLLVLAVIVSCCQATTVCPSKCECLQVPDVINCIARGLTEVPNDGYMPHAKYWYLFNNSITTIHHDTFSIARHFTHPFTIDLKRNQITNVSDEAFSHLENLHTLDLSYNNISHIEFKHVGSKDVDTLILTGNQHLQLPEHGFFLPNLKSLHMDECDLAHIPSKFFAHMKLIAFLHLSKNKLSTLGTHVFSHLTNLAHLYLSRNKFTTIPTALWSQFDKSAAMRVDLNSNPIVCDCKDRSSYDRYRIHFYLFLQCNSEEGVKFIYETFFIQRCPASDEEGHSELGPIQPDPPSRQDSSATAAILVGVVVVVVVVMVAALVVGVAVRLRRKAKERATCPQRFSVLNDNNEDV